MRSLSVPMTFRYADIGSSSGAVAYTTSAAAATRRGKGGPGVTVLKYSRKRRITEGGRARMKTHEVESTARDTIDGAKAGNKVQDSRYELKSDWPDEHEAANRIGGHGNAARGEPFL